MSLENITTSKIQNTSIPQALAAPASLPSQNPSLPRATTRRLHSVLYREPCHLSRDLGPAHFCFSVPTSQRLSRPTHFLCTSWDGGPSASTACPWPLPQPSHFLDHCSGCLGACHFAYTSWDVIRTRQRSIPLTSPCSSCFFPFPAVLQPQGACQCFLGVVWASAHSVFCCGAQTL